MKKRVFVILIVVLGAAGAVWWYYGRRTGDDALVLSGAIEAHTTEVGSLVGGRVAAVHVKEGDRVAAGQPIVTFEPDLLDLQIAQQQARVVQLEADLVKTKTGPRPEDLRQARIDWESAEVDRKRFQSLWETGVIARRDYDEAQVKAAKALEAYRAAQRGGRHEDVAAAKATVAQEEAQLAYLQRQRQELEVAAPKPGVVEVFDLRPGDLVAANAPVATLLEPGQLWVRVFVPETQLGRVHLGQKAWLTVDTFKGRTFPGKVTEIRDQAEYTPRNVQTLEQRSDQVFGVKVEVEPNPELKAGMAALVKLEPPPTPSAR
jgi:multidrug resistance efflux pump